MICDATDKQYTKSQTSHTLEKEEANLADLTFLLLTGISLVLLAATTYVVMQYYQQLLRAKKEYEKAKGSVDDIVLSFNRELKREAEKLEKTSYGAEIALSKVEACSGGVKAVETRLAPLETSVQEIVVRIESLRTSIGALSDADAKVFEKVAKIEAIGLETKIVEIQSSRDSLLSKISSLEEQVQKLSITPEAKLETIVPVIPIRRDKALASLTETEITVLEYLSTEGPKTAPEIQGKVGLSREHTARLMKKLYEEGYLERETNKLPFKYSIKTEMERLLKKTESQ